MGKKSEKPEETTYKKRVSWYRSVVKGGAAYESRDPRFDKMSGNYNADLFEKSYSFIKDMKESEQRIVRDELKKTKNLERRQELHSYLERQKSRDFAKHKEQQQQQLRSERRKAEQSLIEEGKKPFYLKQSEQRRLDTIDQFERLKARNPNLNVEQLTEKHRRRVASKQKASLPFAC